MNNDVKDFVYAYFIDKGAVLGNSEEEKLSYNYTNSGVIDSFGLMTMIMSLESEFDIRFSAEDMQLPSFRTTQGLIEKTTELIANKEG